MLAARQTMDQRIAAKLSLNKTSPPELFKRAHSSWAKQLSANKPSLVERAKAFPQNHMQMCISTLSIIPRYDSAWTDSVITGEGSRESEKWKVRY